MKRCTAHRLAAAVALLTLACAVVDVVGLTAFAEVGLGSWHVTGATDASRVSAEGSWSAPLALEPSTDYAFSPELAVAEDGEAIAGWFTGARAETVLEPGVSSARTAAWAGSTLEVDLGTVAGGFGAPVVLSSHATDSEDGLHVAVSGSGVAYAVWSELPSRTWMIATAPPGGALSAPRALVLPGSIDFLGLVASREGPVAAVWVSSGSSPISSVLHYALLRSDGSLGPEVTVGAWSSGGESLPFALNDHGAFAAVGVAGENGVEVRATQPPRPVVTLCDAAGHCSLPHVLKLGRISAGSFESDAVSLSDDGTATVLAGYSKAPKHPGPNTRFGLWEAVRRPEGRWVTTQQLSPTGEFPLATADGSDGALTVFQAGPGGEPGALWLDWSTLPATGSRFAKPTKLSGPGAPYPPVLAVNMAGDPVIAWYNDGSSGIVNPADSSVFAAIGNDRHLDPAQDLATGNVAAKTMQTGIDSVGEAIVIWSDWIDNEPRGVFAAIHRP